MSEATESKESRKERDKHDSRSTGIKGRYEQNAAQQCITTE